MLRKLALSLAIAGVLGVPNANALGLGEINIRSALNEPLSAEIRLTQVRDLSPLQIQPRMADADEFSIAGLSKSRFLNDVSFQVQVSPDGSGVIRISSTEPVREPFLNFLVEVNWPNGRLVREYTLLLDPPVFDSSPVSGGQFQPVVTNQPGTQSRSSVQPAATSSTGSSQSMPGEVRVGSNDTLWVLANRYRPDSSITPQQMMIALQRNNPNVFPTANINMMRAGTVMRIPSMEEIQELTAAEANAEVNRQTEEWRNRNQPAPEPEPDAEPEEASPEADVSDTDGIEETTQESTEEEEPSEVEAQSDAEAQAEAEALAAAAEALAEAELRIVTPEDDLATDQANDIGDTATSEDNNETDELAESLLQRSDQFDNRLIVLEEDLDRTRLENEDLKEMNDSLQEQLVLLQRMMELQAEQLAQIQQAQLEAQAAEAEQPSSIVETLTSLPVVGGLIAAVIALLGALLLGRKKKKPEPMFKAPDAVNEKSSSAPEAAAVAAAGTAAAAAVADDEEPVEEPETDELPAQTDENDVDDFSDLDLDLDLDLDMDDTEDESVRVVDEEYDLSADDDFADLLSDSEVDESKPAQEGLSEQPQEEPLDETQGKSQEEPENAESDRDDSTDSSLEDLLGEEIPEPSSSVEPSAEESDDDLGSLDDLLMSDVEALEDESLQDNAAEELAGEKVAAEDQVSEEESVQEEVAEDEEGSDEEQAPEDDIPAEDTKAQEDDSDDLDFVLSDDIDEPEDAKASEESASTSDDDLDSLLGSLELEEDDVPASKMKPGEQVEEELTANIMHDLETDLDDELDDLLTSTDDDIELEENQSSDEAIDMLDSLNLLDGADENETKLDLARAYLEMDDSEGAREILGEIIAEGNDDQKQEAQKLLDNLS